MDKTFRKKYIIFLIFIFSCMYAVKDEELFLKGNTYYKAKDYHNAVSAYRAIQEKSLPVLYALGNCYFYTQDYAQALVYWLRAQDVATFTQYNTIERNKKLLYKKISKQQPDTFTTSIVGFFNTIACQIPLLFLQILFLLCFYMLVIYSSKRKRTKNTLILGCFYFSLFMIGILMNIHYKKINTRYGIISQEKISLFAGPHKDFHQLQSLTYADNVIIKDTRDGWHKIQYTDMIGWIEADALHIV